MDNKQQQSYTRQGSSKTCLSADSRKSTDLYTNKPWPRNTRRRENPTASKNDTQRSGKQLGPAKVRTNVDKRPKARGGSVASGVGVAGSFRSTSPEDTDATGSGLAYDFGSAIGGTHGKHNHEYELNSVYAAGSKKQNLNHLLNFHCSPREYGNSTSTGLGVFGRPSSGGVHGRQGHQYAKKHKYNKEQFMQANFQFVIKMNTRPKINASPDALIDWSFIEQINIQTTEEPQCPICLYPPIAAKLTRCGHAYCWPCILHYLALSDKTWRKCPICYEAIHINDLKSATIVQQTQVNAGEYITFHLMRRKKGSLFIEKYKSASPSVERFPLCSTDDDARRFSKFLIAKRGDILDIIEREQQELISGEDSSCPEFVFIQQALDLLKERKLQLGVDEKTADEPFTEIVSSCEIAEEKINVNAAIGGITQSSDGNIFSLSPSEDENLTISHLSEPIDHSLFTPTSVTSKYYYFYQSEDGQNIYLHPLNVKMLQACYGSLDLAPLIINSRIIQKEHHSMDEDLRRKFTCLGHLPLTCQFAVVEVHLDPPVVSEAILKLFKNDILLRKKERQRRDREEKKREKHINEINDRQMGKLISSTANINLSSSHEFPMCGFEEPLLIPSPSNKDLSDGAFPATSPRTINRNTYSSIANIAGSPKNELWPTLGTSAVASSGGSSYQELSSWATKTSAVAMRQQQQQTRRALSDRSSECDSIAADCVDEFQPTLRTNLGDVLAEAINQKNNRSGATASATADNDSSTAKACCTSGSNKKSKKNKKMLLFSTGMNFGGN